MFEMVYVEKEAVSYEITEKVLSKLPKARIFYIDDANDIFKRPNQNFSLEKKHQALILAVNRGTFVYEASDNCQSFGEKNFYYASVCKNCIYNCDYCYLQGMYRCGFVLAYVNIQKCFDDIDKILEKHKNEKILMPISYDSDIYALEGLFGYIKKFDDFLNDRPNLICEVRTKCGTTEFLKDFTSENLVFTWSFNSRKVIELFEKRTAGFDQRIKAIEKAVENGKRVRVAVDPVIPLGSSAEEYVEAINSLRSVAKNLDGVSVGMFRIPPDFLKIMRKNAPHSPLAFEYFETKNGQTTYSEKTTRKYLDSIAEALESIGVPKEKIFR